MATELAFRSVGVNITAGQTTALGSFRVDGYRQIRVVADERQASANDVDVRLTMTEGEELIAQLDVLKLTPGLEVTKVYDVPGTSLTVFAAANGTEGGPSTLDVLIYGFASLGEDTEHHELDSRAGPKGANPDAAEPTEIFQAEEEGKKSDDDIRKRLAEYQRQIEEARAEAHQIPDKIRAETRQILEETRKQDEAQQKLTQRENREESERFIQDARSKIRHERDAALDEVRRSAGAVTTRIPDSQRFTHVTKVLLGDEALERLDDPQKGLEEGLEEGALKITEVAQALFAYITLLIVLSFPIGIVVLWLQLRRVYGYDFSKSLYAASVTSKIVVIGEIVDVLILSTLLLLALISLWVIFHFIYASTKIGKAALGYAVVLSIPVVFIVFAVGVFSVRPQLLWDLGEAGGVSYLLWILGIVLVGAVIAGILLWRARTEVFENRWSRYGGVATLYLASTAAAICWAGLGNLSLPNVALSVNEQGSTTSLEERSSLLTSMSSADGQKVAIDPIANSEESPQAFVLLSNVGNYWYVVDSCKRLLAIPNDLVTQTTQITGGKVKIKRRTQCHNNPPALVDSGANDALGDEGDLLKSDGTFFDPDISSPPTLSVPSNTQGQFTDNGDGTWSWKLNTNDDVDKASLTVTATDSHGATTTDTFIYRADNVTPEATFNPPTVDEGHDVSLSLSDPSDPGREDTFTYAFACDGDGYTDFRRSNNFNCSTNDDGSRSVKAKIRDDDGGVAKYSDAATVTNVAPTAILKSPSVAINEGSGRFNLSLIEPSDPGSKDTLEYRFDCGNGNYGDWGSSNSTYCSVSGDSVTLVVKAQIRDDDGGVSEEYTKSVQVKQPSTPPIPQGENEVDVIPKRSHKPPVLTSAEVTPDGRPIVKGHLVSAPNRACTVRFFANSRNPNGRTVFIGKKSIITGADGHGSFTFSARAVSAAKSVSSVATNAKGTSSQFSASRVVSASNEFLNRSLRQ
jgi:hypothetical protein